MYDHKIHVWKTGDPEFRSNFHDRAIGTNI